MVGEERKVGHVLAFPWPAQGHINPMLQFSNLLASKGVKVTVITTTQTIQSAQIKSSTLVDFECISVGGSSSNDNKNRDSKEVEQYFVRFRETVSRSLVEIIDKYNNGSNNPPKAIVFDSLMTWAMDVAREKGLIGACLFTQTCSVCAIYYHLLQQGKCSSSTTLLENHNSNNNNTGVVSMPSLPPMEEDEMPCFSYFKEASKAVESFVIDQLAHMEKQEWIFFNTFLKLEEEVVNWMSRRWQVKPVGPIFLPSHLDKRQSDDDAKIDLFKPSIESCMEWLNSRETGSVVYVSFGSSVCLEKEQMEEIAWGLNRSDYYFLWVVRESEECKLPETFKTETSSDEKGLIVNWCPQLDVLAHRAVACFMTHCGWNSTLEALSLGVPMIAIPQWVDQTTNAKFVEDVWQVGVRLRPGETGIVTRDDVQSCLNQVMQEERLKMLTENASRWKTLAEEAVHEGGNSYGNINDFLSCVI